MSVLETRPQGAEIAVRIRLMGRPSWERADGRGAFFAPNDALLVAILALDGAQPRDVLAGKIWPSVTDANAANNMRQRFTQLRRKTGHMLFNTGATVSLAAGVAPDVWALATMSVNELLEAGDLLAGLEFGANDLVEQWLDTRRAELRRSRADALAGTADVLAQRGELAAALRLSERIVSLTPLQEHAWRRQMRLHYLRGDRIAAVDAFERFEALLHEHTGARPGKETLELLSTIESESVAWPTPHAPLPVSLMRPPRLVGREGERKAMTRAWVAGRAFVLTGDAGLGKSRLLGELYRARPGVVADQGRPGDAETPYAVMGRLLATVLSAFPAELDANTRAEVSRIVAGLGPAPNSPGHEGGLWQAIERLLAAAAAAGLSALLVDDLHLADAASMEVMRWLAASPALAELRWGVASRPVRDGPIARLLQDWYDDSHRPDHIELRLLEVGDIESLLASLGLPELVEPGLAQRLHDHAGGHPLFTLETLKEVVSHQHGRSIETLPSPRSAQVLIDRRLRDLPARAQALLRVAAVAGDDLTAERAARMLDCSLLELSEPWSDLEAGNVLQDGRFAHDLIHESAIRSVPSAVRRPLHAALAALLSGEMTVPPARVALHWEAAERWSEAGVSWRAAGLAARLAGRLVEQQALCERAASCHHKAGDASGEFDALYASVDSLLLRHGGSAVLELLPRLNALVTTPRHQLLWMLAQIEALIDREMGEDALLVASRAVELARMDPSLLGDALCLQGMAFIQCGMRDEAIAAERAAAEAAATAGIPAQEMRAVRSLAYVLYSADRLAESLTAQRRALTLAEALGDHAEAATAEGNIAALLGVVGDVPASRDSAQRARARYRAMGMSTNSTLGCMNLIVLGMAEAYLARFRESLIVLQEAVRMAGDAAVISAHAKSRISLASVWLNLGRPNEARELVAGVPASAPPTMRAQIHWILARADAMEGLSPQHDLDCLDRLVRQHADLPLVQSAWIEWSYQGDPAIVIPRLRLVRAEFERLGLSGTSRTVMLREVARLGDRTDGESVRTAARLAATLVPFADGGMNAKTYPPEAWLILAGAFERGGDVATARSCRAHGLAWIRKRAIPDVPETFRETFLGLNPVNRALLEGQ